MICGCTAKADGMLGDPTYSTVIGTLDFEAPLLASSWPNFKVLDFTDVIMRILASLEFLCARFHSHKKPL